MSTCSYCLMRCMHPLLGQCWGRGELRAKSLAPGNVDLAANTKTRTRSDRFMRRGSHSPQTQSGTQGSRQGDPHGATPGHSCPRGRMEMGTRLLYQAAVLLLVFDFPRNILESREGQTHHA